VDIDIGITHADRKAVADGLSRLLADSYALYQRMQVHEKAAWMLRGMLA
jgi:DNA-binding ferritin-like protein